MQTLTKQLVDLNLSNRVMTGVQLTRLIDGSKQRRYHLVNRAIKAGELLRLRSGLYLLDKSFRSHPIHPFALAQAFVPGSYVSYETALAHHGWIPEAVYSTASATPERKSSKYENTIFGDFSFHPLATQPGCFLELVDRELSNKQSMLVASPMRALIDLVSLRKAEWHGMDWLTEGLRIDYEHLQRVTRADIQTLKLIYKQKRVNRFIDLLASELGND